MSELGDRLGELLARLRIGCVVDVGAHLGQFGRLVRERGYDGPIVSFEPVLAVFAALTKTCCSRDPAWQAHRLALGSSDGTAVLNVARSSDFSSFLLPNALSLAEFGGYTAVERRERVPLRRLDSVAAYLPPGGDVRILLKVDTQGWDLEVLRGAEATLPRVEAVLCELSLQPLYEGAPGADEVTGFLRRHGFEPAASFPVTQTADRRPIEVDCLLVRAGEEQLRAA